MTEVSTLRLYLLRASYLLLVVGLGLTIWPLILHHAPTWERMHSVAACLLGALSALSVLGLRYPLRMLPLLLFEVAWKAIWLAAVALPLWLAHRMDAATTETAFECLMAAIFLFVIPWGYVYRTYVTAAGDPWGGRAALN
ncbi:MAG TPA: hypothetical protein VGI30_12025 [Caulobacteraceae bacterium]